VRETADRETPARLATCSALTKDFTTADFATVDFNGAAVFVARRALDRLSEVFRAGMAQRLYAIVCNCDSAHSKLTEVKVV